ncbi:MULTISPECIES: YdiK family protein [Ornithinibacillus]|uniref:YdiK family protein n=2 Tax=Ornithinibacillus TaxID=484508 RepID=A0A923L4L3_9BACI|nr:MULTISPECIES: YdiK family protein [Ornithinibacillus]MBC5636388.1 YdiK family protein [Ornithinibacillus hominis]MBS3681256.1 YdiK family protein [Ornithinibacillus massiliensis]
MRITARTLALIYFTMGVFFIYVAISFAEETVFNFMTILLAIFATLDFGAGIRYMRLHYKLKNIKKK